MKVTSNDSLLLDELYNDLRLEHIEVNKQTTITKGSMAVDGITSKYSKDKIRLMNLFFSIQVMEVFQTFNGFFN